MAKSATIPPVVLLFQTLQTAMAKAAKTLTSNTFDGTSADHVFEAITRFIKDVVQGQDDRIAIVVGAAMLHMQLADMLKAFLKPSQTANDELLHGEQGLSTLSNQTKLANRLGVLDDDLCFVLDGIRKLRNDYAHDIFAGSLNQSPYADRIEAIAARYKGVNVVRGWLNLDESPSSKIRAAMYALSTFMAFLRSNVKEPISAWAVVAAAREAAMKDVAAKQAVKKPAAVAMKKDDAGSDA